MMQKQRQTQELKSCLRTYSSLQGYICTYWNKATCNKCTCKHLHASVACILPLQITQNQEITIIISKQITLSPQEACDNIAKNYKNSNKGIAVILNKPKALVDLKKIVGGNAADKKKQAHEISKFLEKLKSLKKQRQQEKQIVKKSNQEDQNVIQSREEKINPDLKSASQKKQLQQQLIKTQNQDKHNTEIKLDKFNQIRNIEQVEKEKYKASKLKGILKHTTPSMEQISNPTSQSSSSEINEPSSSKTNLRMPTKVKSIITNHEENKKDRRMCMNDELLKRELDTQSQIQSLNVEVDQLKKNQDQLHKELILLLSATDSSASSSKQQSQTKK